MVDFFGFIKEYYWDYLWMHKGYNMYNTLTYAVIALIALYFVYKWIKKNYKLDKKFLTTLIVFILFGSTFRVVVDSYDSYNGISRVGEYIQSNGLFSPLYSFISSLHIYDYSPLTVTPGIYILTAVLFFVSLIMEKKFKFRIKFLTVDFGMFSAWKVGLVLWLVNFLILVPLIQYPMYPILIILLALLATGIVYIFLRNELNTQKTQDYILGVFGHALDGAATFMVVDMFNALEPACRQLGRCYGEQHVVSSIIGGSYGYVTFFALKVFISALAVKLVNDEVAGNKISRDDALFFVAILMTLGLAPGVRDLLRVMVGA